MLITLRELKKKLWMFLPSALDTQSVILCSTKQLLIHSPPVLDSAVLGLQASAITPRHTNSSYTPTYFSLLLVSVAISYYNNIPATI